MPIPNQPNPFLHNRSNVQSIGVSSICRDDPDPSHLFHRQERFIQRLAHVGLQRQRLADLVNDRLGFVESGSVDSDVQSLGNELFDLLSHVCVDGEVDGVYAHLLRLGETVGYLVDPDDAGGTFEESPFSDTKSDGTQSLKSKHMVKFAKRTKMAIHILPKYRRHRPSSRQYLQRHGTTWATHPRDTAPVHP